LQTDIQKELQLTDLSPNRINFLNKSLAAVKDKQKNVSEALRKEYPNLFTGKEGDISGALVQEHKIARALGDKRLKGEAGKSFIPSTYLARAEFTPAFFNLQKLKDFDTPFMSLVEKYNKAPTKESKLAVKEQIETLKNTFNKNSGGYLNDVDINYGTKTVKIKDKTPEIYKTSKEDTYAQILKNVKHSNTYFKNKGMNDRILQGDEFNRFQRDLKNRINTNQSYKSLAIGVPTAAVATQFLSGEANAADGTEAKSILPEAAAGAAAGALGVGTKTGRNVLGKAFRTLGTRAAAVPLAGYTVYDNLKKGENVADAVLDPMVGIELMLPNMFKENVSKITSNPTIQKLLKIGKFGRAFTPIGAGITAAGLGIDAYKYGKERKQLLDSLTDEQKTELFRKEQSDVVKQQLRGDQNAFDEFSAARGGIASLNVKK